MKKDGDQTMVQVLAVTIFLTSREFTWSEKWYFWIMQ